MFRYEIGVEDGAKRNQVVLSESDLPEKLRPLIEWLQAKAGVT
jgi:hypothetical protein